MQSAPAVPTIEPLSDSTVSFTLEIDPKKGVRVVLPKKAPASLKTLAQWYASRCSPYTTVKKNERIKVRFDIDGPNAPCRSTLQGRISPDLLLWNQRNVPVAAPEPDVNDFSDVEREPSYDEMALARRVRYPTVAKANGIEGIVLIGALIGTRGCIEKIVVIESENEVLNDAAIDAVANTRFTPAMQNNKPIRVWARIPLRFALR
jgi:TonB family protein